MSLAIEQAIKRDDWKVARQLIRTSLLKQPNSHWLIARLALTYYEERDYKRALTLVQRAHKLAPRCPLVLWDLAGNLEMLGRHREAITIYRRLVQRNINALASGVCGEGLSWARSLVADCWYRLAGIACKLGRKTQAIQYYQQHFEMRIKGCRSIYPIKDVRKEFKALLVDSQKQNLIDD